MTKVTVQGIHVEVTDSIKDHVEDQFSKVLEHFEDHITGNLEVKISVNQHHAHLKSASVKVPVVGAPVHIEEEGKDMYKVLTTLADKAERQLRKLKDKKQVKGGIDKRMQEE